MPFTNVQTASLGPLKVTFGDWTFTEAAASETIGVSGGRVYLAEFTSQDSSGALKERIRHSVSLSGNVTTVTVYGQEGVTTGQFLIIHKGG